MKKKWSDEGISMDDFNKLFSHVEKNKTVKSLNEFLGAMQDLGFKVKVGKEKPSRTMRIKE